ncbi:MAG: hypothetical protein WD269_11750 [Acidimicrobiia bacterium]
MLGEAGRHEAVIELHRQESLAEVKKLIEVRSEETDDGWGRESARLFAIDIALLTTRRHFDRLSAADSRFLMVKLNEARRLVVDDRDHELGLVQGEFEPYLKHVVSPGARVVWLTALNALLPSPYRAAVAALTAALTASPDQIEDLSAILGQRLRARLGEGALLREKSGDLFAIA